MREAVLGDAERPHGCGAVAAADHGERAVGGAGRRPPRRRRGCPRRTAPARTRPSGRSRRPCGPPASASVKRTTLSGPMSRPIRSAGMASAATTSCSASAEKAVAATTSTGSTTLPVARKPRQASSWSASSRLDPDAVALGREEREAHPAADQQRVDGRQQRLDHLELVADLGARRARPRTAAPGPRREAVEHRPSRTRPADRRRAAGAARRRRRWRAGGAPPRRRRRRRARRAPPAGRPGRRARRRPCSSRPASKRTFSSSTSSPSAERVHPGAAVRAGDVGRPAAPAARAARRSRAATGARLYAGSGAPLGRPRWAVTTTRAPRSSRSRSSGTLARTRPSSVIRCPSSGTLRSLRTRTRRPSTSRSAAVRI